MRALTQVLPLAAAAVLGLPGTAAAGWSSVPVQQSTVAVWRITAGCVETVTTLSSVSSVSNATWLNQPNPAAAFLTISQVRACPGEPPVPLREITGTTSERTELVVRDHLTSARLSATVPVHCHAAVPGACAQAPYTSPWAGVEVAWQGRGGGLRSTAGDRTCLYRSSQANGSVRLADFDAIRDAHGHVVWSDRDASSVGRCGGNGLDAAFGPGGTVVTDLAEAVNLFAVTIQPDGRIVVAGQVFGESIEDFVVARYEPSGRLDPSFGTGGWVRTDFHGRADRALAVAVAPDGHIVVAGQSGRRMAVARYGADGTLDRGFGGDGRVTIDLDQSTANDVAVDAAGRIVLAGGVLHPVGPSCCSSDFAVVRLTGAGAPDDSFGTHGIVRTDFVPGAAVGFDAADAVLLQPDGRIVVAGEGNEMFGLARYLLDGSLDRSFGADGRVTTGETGLIRAIAFDVDGRIVAGGQQCQASSDAGPRCDFMLARYHADGRLDHQFGGNGIVRTDVRARFGEGITGIAVQPDGHIMAAGFVTGLEPGTLTGTDVAVVRYHTDGHPDLRFGSGGVVIDAVSTGDDLPEDVALDAAGRLVVVGTTVATTIGPGPPDGFLSRFSTAP